MQVFLRQIVNLPFKGSDISLVLERLHSHTLKPRMSPEEFSETIFALGYNSAEEFADDIGLPHRTVQSWARFGLVRDAAQLLLAMLDYRQRVSSAIREIDQSLKIGLEDFFTEHDLP